MVKGYIDKNMKQQQTNSQYKSNKKEGDVTINYSTKGNKKSFDGEGEYVDFEEID